MLDPDTIDHKIKAANKKAMEYYIETKVLECKKGLLKKLLFQHYDWPSSDFVNDLDLNFNRLPIDVAIQYNNSIVSYKNRALLNYAQGNFLRYVFKIESENRYLVLDHKIDSDRQSLKLLETRYHNSYCKKIKKRMDWLSYNYNHRSCVLLTLTLDPKKFNNDKFVMWDNITSELDRFMQALRMHIKRAGRVFPKYLWAVEGQKNGNPHIHIVFFNSTRLIDWRKILDYWGNGAIYLNKTVRGEKVRYPVNYVTGYITKTFGNTNFDNLQTQSLVWLFNLHSFNRSHGLVVPLNPKGCGDWCLSYFAVVDVMPNRFDEMDSIKKCLDGLLDPKKVGGPPGFSAAGEYVIWSDANEIVSTDSIFWAKFFGCGAND